MTTTKHTLTSAGMPVGGSSPWREELERYLRPAHFPARVDQLLSTMARHRAPSHLYWRLASLPLSRAFEDVSDLTAALEGQTQPLGATEPI